MIQFVPHFFTNDSSKREFFGKYSPYADLIDAVTNPPPLYNTKDGIGLKVKDKDIEKLLHLDLNEVFFGGIKKMKISSFELVDDFNTKTELK